MSAVKLIQKIHSPLCASVGVRRIGFCLDGAAGCQGHPLCPLEKNSKKTEHTIPRKDDILWLFFKLALPASP